jgi:hypothetical protein
MKKENEWSAKAKAPDPDDLTADQLPAKPKHIDYTAMEHHGEIPDSADTGDISRPQGEFWHRNERPGAEAIDAVRLESSRKNPPRR